MEKIFAFYPQGFSPPKRGRFLKFPKIKKKGKKKGSWMCPKFLKNGGMEKFFWGFQGIDGLRKGDGKGLGDPGEKRGKKKKNFSFPPLNVHLAPGLLLNFNFD